MKTLVLVASVVQAGHIPVPESDPREIDDPSPPSRPRFLKNPTAFTLIEKDDGSIEDFADDNVHSLVGTFSTWVDKKSREYFFVVRPSLLSRDKPDRVTIFGEISPAEDLSLKQSMICDMYTKVDLLESPTQIAEQIVF